jgi:hypothetical protein
LEIVALRGVQQFDRERRTVEVCFGGHDDEWVELQLLAYGDGAR